MYVRHEVECLVPSLVYNAHAYPVMSALSLLGFVDGCVGQVIAQSLLVCSQPLRYMVMRGMPFSFGDRVGCGPMAGHHASNGPPDISIWL